MVLRKRLFTSLSTGLLPLLSASFSHALVIQPVQVKSALGEPFYAEVGLSDLNPSDLKNISVGLANPQELADLGVKPGSYRGTLTISLQEQPGNRGVVVIRSGQPVNEPIMDFVLRVKTGQNIRLQRINAMIDPANNHKKIVSLKPQAQVTTPADIQLAVSSMPTIDALDVQPEKTSNTAQERRLAVLRTAPPDMKPTSTVPVQVSKPVTPASAPREVEVSTTPKNNQPRHVVKNNESLWKIAKQLEPQLKQPVGQIMQRIRDMNQDAFIAGDPNQLKRGATLILPEHAQKATLVNASQPAPVPAAKKPPLTPPVTTTEKTVRSGRLPKAELTLIAPTTQGSPQGSSNTGQKAGFQPLSREMVLKIGQERRKTVLMQHEVSELDAQLALNDKKIAMLNAKLAELEHQLKTRNQARGKSVQQQMKALPPKKAANAIIPLFAFASMALFGFMPNLARAAEGDGGGGGFPLWLIPVALLVIAVIVKVVQGKSADKRPARGKTKRPVRRAAPATRKAQPAARPVAPQQSAPVPVARPVAQPEVKADVLQEVQSYIERDRYSQAVGLLRDAIAKTPERADLQVKLLEVLALQNDIDAFENQFNIVTAFNQPELTEHAEKMRALLQPKAVEQDFSPVEDLDFNFDSSSSAMPEQTAVQDQGTEYLDIETQGTQNQTIESNTIEFDSHASLNSANVEMPQEIHAPTSTADQSLAELEAEFGFTQEPISPAPESNLDFKLDELETTPQAQPQSNPVDFAPATSSDEPALQPEDTPIDLEFDLNDSFNLEEVEAPKPAVSTTFELDLEDSLLEKPVESIPAPASTQVNLDELHVEDTNWADGFEDQDFNIGSSGTPAQTTTAAVASAAQTDSNPEDFLAKEFPFLVNLDVQQTNLELAESYINLGERANARELLDEVISQGNPQQQAQAQHLMRQLAS
ncbi:FimV/HubP family polar landmark protein [Alkanindiges sp. WGS2144]|uniref:FimV/HubP family polar landmark protein n=1 Tax=Alkanindiges sp. WGS2144 TaxID=3366808 RepID=UPI0037536012